MQTLWSAKKIGFGGVQATFETFAPSAITTCKIRQLAPDDAEMCGDARLSCRMEVVAVEAEKRGSILIYISLDAIGAFSPQYSPDMQPLLL